MRDAGEAQMSGAPTRLRTMLLAASIVPVLLGALAIWLNHEYDRQAEIGARVRLAYRQQLALERLVSRIKDAETGQRGYVITGDRAFLKPYLDARAFIPRAFDELGRAFATTSTEEARQIGVLEELARAKFVELDRVLHARDTQGLAAAQRIVAEGAGKRVMDDIRVHVAAMGKTRDATLRADRSRESRRTDLIEIASWTIVFVGSVAAFLTTFLVWRYRTLRYAALREREEAAARQKAIFENSLDAIVLVNPSGGIEILNPAASRLFGYPPTDLQRRDIALIANIAPGDGTFLQRVGLVDGAIEHPFRSSLTARRRDGETVQVEAALAPMPLDDGIHIVVAFRDISERIRTERMKDEFLSTVSHELRTPLTSILGALSLIRAGATGPIPTETQRLVTIAENNANRLIRLVNDLLDMEKLQSGGMRFSFSPIDLGHVCQSALDALHGLAESRSIALKFSAPAEAIMLEGDDERLIQVISNLLSNAIRFSPQGSEVQVRAGLRDGRAHVSVIDQGPGVEEELRGRLFTRFAQGSQISGATPGTGLGLAISREIVRTHGGDIWWEETPGGGSTFTFALPLKRTATMHGAALLLFADETDVAALVRTFNAQSVATDIVTSAEATVAALQARRYLALIVDFQFANGAALPLIAQLRADPELRGLPVIAVVGEQPPVLPEEVAALEIIDWIEKPISSDRLTQAMDASVQRAIADHPLILHVDDDEDTLEVTARAFAGVARVAHARDVATARAFIAANPVDVIILDMGLPDGSGLEVLEGEPGSAQCSTPVVIYSAEDRGNAPTAGNIRAMLTKSKRSLPSLVETVAALLERSTGNA